MIAPGAAARAVYEATSADYARLVGTTISATTETAGDRQLLVDLVRAAGDGLIADLGSGPGRVAALCLEEGRTAVAVDMTIAMLRAGQAAHHDVPFVAAYLSSLPFADASFGAAVLWYSIIHTPPRQLEPLLREARRILVTGAPILIAFQAGGGETHERDDAYGTGMTMTSWRHAPDIVRAALDGGGFDSCEVTVRPAALPHESTPQAFVSASASH